MLEDQHIKWSAAWADAARSLGLSSSVSTQQATDAATEWAAAAGVFNALDITERRIRLIEEDKANLNTKVEALRKRLNLELPTDAVAAARALKRLVAEAQGGALQRDSLSPQALKARTILEDSALRLKATASLLSDLAAKCRCDVEGLSDVAERISSRALMRQKREQLCQSIVLAGDGFSVEALRVQWQEQDPDLIASQLSQTSQEVAQRELAIEGAIASQQAADSSVRAFLDDDSLNQLIVEREASSGEMHRIIERYIEVTLARSLLTAAIDKVREEQQDPLLARASHLFASCTRGAFTKAAISCSRLTFCSACVIANSASRR